MKKLAATLFFSVFIFSIQAQDGWSWQNPLPQGNPLHSISFVSHCGWAVGPQGTAIWTCDYGETWQVVDLGTSENLNSVYMFDDLRAYIVGDNGLMLFVMEDQVNSVFEITQYDRLTSEDLNSITVNHNACPWVVGDYGTVLRSDDLGETWTDQSVIFNYNLNALDNIECTEAFAVGPDGIVLYTSDLGNTWNYRNTPAAWDLYSVNIGQFDNIRVVGQSGNIWHTVDKGVTWEKEHEDSGYQLFDVINIGTNAAYAVGSDEALLETTDFGETWAKPGTNPELYYTALYDVEDHYDLDHIWVVGYYGVILRNSGIETEFEVQNEGTLLWLHEIEFVSETEGWAVGGIMTDLSGNSKGIILHTIDGGETWEEYHSVSHQINDIHFHQDNSGWMVGRDGFIGHIVNEGFQTVESPIIDGFLTSVCFSDPNNGWIVSRGNWGEVFHTINGGNTWVKQTNPSDNPLHDVFFIDHNIGWAVGLDTTIIRTIDGGQTWLGVAPYTVKGSRYADVYFIDEMKGWVVGTGGVIALTIDGGVNWQHIESGTQESLESVFFIDENNGWIAGDRGTILRSVDGGNSWFYQRTCVSNNFLSSVCFADAQNGWAVGEGGTIIRTTNGGFMPEPGVFEKNGLGLLINDNEETQSTIEVDVSEVIRGEYKLTGLEIYIDTILHPRVSDLEISLTHNDITETIVYHVSDDGENFLWTTLCDDADRIITDGTAPFSGNYKPYTPLTAFNNTDPNGDWTLSIYDSEDGQTGSLQAWGLKPLFEKTTSVPEAGLEQNERIQLHQNIPNPFDQTTHIGWKSDISAHVILKVFNLNGQEIATLVNKYLPSGEYSIEFDGAFLKTGVYYYRLRVGKYMQTRKMVVLR